MPSINSIGILKDANEVLFGMCLDEHPKTYNEFSSHVQDAYKSWLIDKVLLGTEDEY